MKKAVLLIKFRVNSMVELKLQTREVLGTPKIKTTHTKKKFNYFWRFYYTIKIYFHSILSRTKPRICNMSKCK